jgi:hypothetical protein
MANVRIQIRRDYAAKWIENNPILASGEQGYELDTTFMKVGDGVTLWRDLAYWNTGSVQGPPGPIGDDGLQGEQGIQGIQGPIGPSGLSINYIGSGTYVQMLGYPAVQNDGATVTDRNNNLHVYDGTKWNNVGPFAVLPGPQGIPGIDGKDGKDGEQGDQGLNGKSAYQIALDEGFVGTEQEWLDSLKLGPDNPINTANLPLAFDGINPFENLKELALPAVDNLDFQSDANTWYLESIVDLTIKVTNLQTKVNRIEKYVTFSVDAPENPDDGNIWIESTTIKLYIWYGDSWIQLNKSNNVTYNLIPPSDPEIGDLWTIPTTNLMRVWTGSSWEQINAASNDMLPLDSVSL